MASEVSKFNNKSKGKSILAYIGKILSTTILILLLLVGAFLVYYFITSRLALKDPSKKPDINIFTIVSGSMEPTIKVYG